jgi:hypothetical protein
MGKNINFKFKSAKGQDITIDYKPEGIVVNDPKAFQGHLVKVVDLLQCEDKPKEVKKEPEIKGVAEPTANAIEEVESEGDSELFK